MDEQKKIYTSFQKLKSDCIKFVEASKNRGAYKGLKKLLTELYPDKAHFIYELLQNAEDQQADEVYFEVHKDKFIFRHNGKKRDFNLEDIDSITNIGNSTKKDDPTSIGKFGVGFKAVYAYTNTPEIHSGKYNFKIIDMLIPEDTNVEQTSVTGETEFIFPFDNPSKSPIVAVGEIESTLNALDETAILFLRYIKSIKFKLLNGFEGEIFITPNISNIKYLYSITIRTTNETRETLWAKFDNKCPIFVDGKKNDYIVSMSYKIKKEDEKYSVDSDLEGKVCIYFPTDQKSQLRFHINAPFASTVARDNIQYCEENEKLLDALADLAVASLYDLKKHKLLDYSAYEALPTERDFMNAPNSRYKIILNKLTEEFKNAALFIDECGEYKKQEEVYQGTVDMKTILPLDYVRLYYNKTWIPTYSAKKGLRIETFFNQFDIKDFTMENFIDELEKSPNYFYDLFSRQTSNDYFRTLYFVMSQAKEREQYYPYYNRLFNNSKTKNDILSQVDFLFCSDGKLHKPTSKVYIKTKYTPHIYVKNPVYLNWEYKNTDIDRKIKDFLLKLTVKEMNETIDMTANIQGDDISIDDMVFKIMEIIERYKEEPTSINGYENSPIFLVHKIDSPENHCKSTAKDCCVSEEVAFFHNKEECGKFVLSISKYEECLDKKDYNLFLEIYRKLHGNTDLIINEKNKQDSWPSWHPTASILNTNGERSDTMSWHDYIIEGFDFNVLSSIKEQKRYKYALFLWKNVLACNIEDIGKAYYKPNRSATWQILESTIVYYLKRCAWIPTKTGEYKCPYEIEKEDLTEDFYYETPSILLTEILKVPNDLANELRSKGVKNKNIIEAATWTQEEFEIAREAIEKAKLEKRRKTKPFSEIAEGKREQTPEIETADGEYPSTIRNPEKRKIKLEKEFSDNISRQINIFKKLSFCLERPNADEKAYVNEQYHAKCQICGSEGILTANGKRYFEAINIFSTENMDESILQTMHICGWNTLSLCPICATKYKYCQVNFSGIIEQIENKEITQETESVSLSIELQNKATTITFMPKHFLALQTAIKKIKEFES